MVSLLPICGKIIEKLIFDSFFNYVEENELLLVHQSDLRSKDSCVNQLLLIAHNLY